MSMQDDVKFMSNLSAAVVQRNRRESRILVNVILVSVLALLVWAAFAEIDQITRGQGRVVTTSKVQVIQNLEGGIVADIMVHPGDLVQPGQPLLKIDNQRFASSFEESRWKLIELRLKAARLRAETGGKLEFDENIAAKHPDLVANARKLYQAHMDFLDNQITIVKHQIAQRRGNIADSSSRINNLKKKRTLLKEQVAMTEPLVERGIESKTGFLALKRELIDINDKLQSETFAIKNARDAIKELNSKIDDLRMSFVNRAQKELNETVAEILQIKEKQTSLKDQVTRTLVKAPVKGIIKQIFVNTIGGVAKPGMDLVEIVPCEENLLAEVKIKPADIAFLKPGQKAIVKYSAYNFSQYGGLEGKITRISADTITDRRDRSYYLVYVKTDKNYLGGAEKPMKIIPGMTVTVDILTGKRTILDYMLKPLLQMRDKALTER